MLKEIENIEDVKQLVDHFYARVRKDDLIGPIFNEVIQDRWSLHLEKMYQFWQTILLGEHTYRGAPFIPHANLPVTQKHFDRWLELFYVTLVTQFEGDNVDIAKHQASQMAEMFRMKINCIRETKIYS